MAAGSAATAQLRRRTSVSLLSNDQVRSSVVRELVNTERDFVKILRDVAEVCINFKSVTSRLFSKYEMCMEFQVILL